MENAPMSVVPLQQLECKCLAMARFSETEVFFLAFLQHLPGFSQVSRMLGGSTPQVPDDPLEETRHGVSTSSIICDLSLFTS